MHKCKYCNKEFESGVKLGGHVIFCKNNPNRDETRKKISKSKKGRIVLEKQRKKISEGLKKAHKEGRHPGWAHINSNKSRRSYPEKWFIKNILKKYGLYLKYTIIEKMPFKKYFLDFAFLELKLDIEIDGQQHFRSKKTIEHDKKRDKILIENGWRIYRIAWIEIVKNKNIIINDFLNFLESNNLYRAYNKRGMLLDLNKDKRKYGNRNDYSKMKKLQNLKKNKVIVEKILNSYIDFSKFGWVKRVARILNITDQNVNRWMKRNMLEFYEQKCFKRTCIAPRYERGEA